MNRIRRMFVRPYWCAVIFSCLLVVVNTQVYAEPKVGILMPELRAPFKIIFDSIGDGIDQELKTKSSRLILPKEHNPQDITRWLKSENIEAVITLGSLGKKASNYIPFNTPVVLAALTSAPSPTNRYPGVALTPNPGSMFELLMKIDNSRKKIVVVYNPLKNQWLIDLAKRQAADIGVRLVAHKATDLKQAAIIYDENLMANGREDTAIWLLQDRTIIDSKIILPFILEKSWQKDIVVFSSSLGHVKKGVLFAMYPDNLLHGKQAAKTLRKVLSSPDTIGNSISPTNGLLRAINSRTAEHLGLNISPSKLREFDVVFPVSN